MSWLKKRLLKMWAGSTSEQAAGAGKTVARGYFTVENVKYIIWGLVVLAWLCLVGGGAWLVWQSGDAAGVVHEGRQAREVQVDAPFSATGEVPFARLDSTGGVVIERIKVENPAGVEATITTGRDSVPALLWRERDVWLPEFRAPGAGIDAEVLCPPALAPCDTAGVAVTPAPRPLIEIDPSPMVGAGVEVGGGPATELQDYRLYGGLDVLRVGPLHVGAGLTAAPDTLGSVRLRTAGVAGVELRDDLMMTCSREWAGGAWTCGAQLRF